MERHDYRTEMMEDVRNYIEENMDFIKYYEGRRETLENRLNDDLFNDDSVTGNGSGSYYFSSWKAEEALCHNSDLLGEAMENFGLDTTEILEHGPEWCDVIIRCYLLPEVIHDVLDELEAEGKLDEDEETEDED